MLQLARDGALFSYPQGCLICVYATKVSSTVLQGGSVKCWSQSPESCSWWGAEPVNSLALKPAASCKQVGKEGISPLHPPLWSRWGLWRGQLSSTHFPKASSPVSMPPWTALLCYVGYCEYSLFLCSFLTHLCGFLFTALIMFDLWCFYSSRVLYFHVLSWCMYSSHTL